MTEILESDIATKRHDKKCLRVSESHVKNANGHVGNCRMVSDTMDIEESGESDSPIIEERRRFVKNDSSPFF